MNRKRQVRRTAAAMLAAAAAFSGLGIAQAGAGPAATQVATSPTASLAYAFIPPAFGDGTPAFDAMLVIPGAGTVVGGSDGQMNMGQTWAALRAYNPSPNGLSGATENCITLTNPSVAHIDAPSKGSNSIGLTASFDAACGTDVYRVNWTQWSLPFPSTMSQPYALDGEWGETGTSSRAIHVSYLEGSWHYAAQAQICHQVAAAGGTSWSCYAQMSGDAVIAPNVTAVAVQELLTD